MSRRKIIDEPDYVLKNDCNRQHAKIDLALFGVDGREGMVKDITDIKNFMADQVCLNKEERNTKQEEKTEVKKRKRDYRSFVFAVLGGAIVAFVQYFFSHL